VPRFKTGVEMTPLVVLISFFFFFLSLWNRTWDPAPSKGVGSKSGSEI
jgi:hypothetical protein